ncbi:MAG: rRNA maturation RNase YbeY [Clostridia bacterium]|nr:rRNA maturation RNase YbeY [Clostridia bacterium]
MATITISKNKKLPFNASAVADAVYTVLNQTGKLSVEINIVSEDYIKNLNLSTRNIDKVTDVLSYPSLDGVRYKDITLKDFPLDVDGSGKRVFLGSIIICEKRAISQAEEFGHSVDRELCYLCAHGFLHLFGYDHLTEKDDKEMRALADKVMEILKITR